MERSRSAGRTRPDIAVYWFGNWHVDPRMEEWLGRGWTEWELVKAATPRFEGHKQPIVPAWGYYDDADPGHERHSHEVAWAAGVDAFLIDWYWYGGPFLNRPLDEVLSTLTSPVRFALMWANHDWCDVFPAPHDMPLRLLAPARMDAAEFRRATEHAIDNYLTRGRYWRVDGAAYFSIFEVDSLCRWLGGVAATTEALADFRHRARRAGVGELHIAAITTMFGREPVLTMRSTPWVSTASPITTGPLSSVEPRWSPMLSGVRWQKRSGTRQRGCTPSLRSRMSASAGTRRRALRRGNLSDRGVALYARRGRQHPRAVRGQNDRRARLGPQPPGAPVCHGQRLERVDGGQRLGARHLLGHFQTRRFDKGGKAPLTCRAILTLMIAMPGIRRVA